MRLMKGVFALLLVLLTTSAALAAGEFEGSASLGLYNKYIWRGYDLGGDADLLVQPEINLGYAGFSLGVWGNFNESSEKLDEIDLSLEYSHDFSEQVAAKVGHITYSLADGADSAELYAGVTLALPVDVALDAYYDYDELEAWFLACSVSKGLEVAENTTLTLGATVGYFDFDYLNQGEVNASLDYAVGEVLTVTPALLYSTPLSQKAEDSGIDDQFVASLTVAYAF